jgi:DNA invertase Pin-like site-specific DNA recombinase
MPAARRKGPPADPRPPIAISYIRFSGLEQRKGDSKRRQTEASEAWCKRHGMPLDRALIDAGRSAYHGRHRDDKAALGRFLDLAKAGMVPRGSYLNH